MNMSDETENGECGVCGVVGRLEDIQVHFLNRHVDEAQVISQYEVDPEISGKENLNAKSEEQTDENANGGRFPFFVVFFCSLC